MPQWCDKHKQHTIDEVCWKCQHEAGYGLKSTELLKSFTKFCIEHPQQRFWQALRNWAVPGGTIAVGKQVDGFSQYDDTFYWEKKNGF